MKEMIMLTKEEYAEMNNKIKHSEYFLRKASRKIFQLQNEIEILQKTKDQLWNALNRPAIEAAEQKGEKDYLSWCDAIANIYFEDYLYEEESYASWCLYNNIKNNNIEEEREGWTKTLNYCDNVLKIAEVDAYQTYFKSKKGHSAPNEYYRLLAEYFHCLQQSDSVTD